MAQRDGRQRHAPFWGAYYAALGRTPPPDLGPRP